ncbi:MAG: hypothetical protein HY695_28640 [Deltaproteobacteria bacterium]|nr:hypothetical protein [Deltaproteobacteria bacterium]
MEARRLVLLQAFLAIILILSGAPAAYADQDETIQEALGPSPELNLFSPYLRPEGFRTFGLGATGSSDLLKLDAEIFKIRISHSDRREQPALLGSDASHRGFLKFLAVTDQFEGIVGEGEVVYSYPGLGTTGGMAENGHTLLRLGLKGNWLGFGYGADYQSVEKDFVSLTGARADADQEGGQLWVERKFGSWGAKSYVAESWGSIGPGVLRVTQTTVNSLTYHGGNWGVSLSSSHAWNKESAVPGREILVFSNSLIGSYRPTPAFTLTPTMTFVEEKDRLAALTIRKPVASVVLQYVPLRDFLTLNAVGSFSKAMGDKALIDSRTFDATAGINWILAKSRWQSKILSFNLTYQNHLDSILPNNSREDFSGSVVFKITSF